MATGDGDVVRRRLREERPEVGKGVSSGGVRWRWWEMFHRQLVVRGFAGRIVTALWDMGVVNMSCNGSCASKRAVMSAICSRSSASVSSAGASDL
jgi:hypothetical protein